MCTAPAVFNGLSDEEFALSLLTDEESDDRRGAQALVGHVRAVFDHSSAVRARCACELHAGSGRGFPPHRWPLQAVHGLRLTTPGRFQRTDSLRYSTTRSTRRAWRAVV